MPLRSEGGMMKLTEYLEGLRAATTAEELEAALHVDFKHPFHGPTWSRICKVREEVGEAICRAHPNGRFVPTFGPRRVLQVCGETYKVGRGGNSTGVRYVWTYAQFWAVDVLKANGLSQRAAYRIWDCWGNYPHRCLPIIADALAGKIPDPELNVLIRHERTSYGSPVNITVEKNEGRAMKPCECGGTLFDWGAGHSLGFDFVNWHCNKCPEVFTEYLGEGGLAALRNPKPQVAA